MNEKNKKTPDNKRKIRALILLCGLVVAGLLFLLGVHALIVGKGSMVFDLFGHLVIVATGAAMFSGLIFPLAFLLIIPFFPLFILYLFIRNR